MLNHIRVALAEREKTNRILAEKLGKNEPYYFSVVSQQVASISITAE